MPNLERHYLVTWRIDSHAATPQDAAMEALIIQRDPNSVATVFEVKDLGTGVETRVDLEEESRGRWLRD